MLDLNEFAVEVHENAKAHGWWDENRGVDEIIALIHSEWSEALEEFRAGRPMVWYKAVGNCNNCADRSNAHPEYCTMQNCTVLGRKPEGIAVELIDGCIRILDYLGYLMEVKDIGVPFDFRINTAENAVRATYEGWKDMPGAHGSRVSLPIAVCKLHSLTAAGRELGNSVPLVWAVVYVLAWVHAQGLNPEALMKEKHEYNKTRPYKHGGKVC